MVHAFVICGLEEGEIRDPTLPSSPSPLTPAAWIDGQRVGPLIDAEC